MVLVTPWLCLLRLYLLPVWLSWHKQSVLRFWNDVQGLRLFRILDELNALFLDKGLLLRERTRLIFNLRYLYRKFLGKNCWISLSSGWRKWYANLISWYWCVTDHTHRTNKSRSLVSCVLPRCLYQSDFDIFRERRRSSWQLILHLEDLLLRTLALSFLLLEIYDYCLLLEQPLHRTYLLWVVNRLKRSMLDWAFCLLFSLIDKWVRY